MFAKIGCLFLLTLNFLTLRSQSLEKKYLENQTYEYQELKLAYKFLAQSSSSSNLRNIGPADNGDSIQLFEINSIENETEHQAGIKILILNGIHSGESCGVDASLHWAEKIINHSELIGSASIYIVPVYNIGGSLNRSCCTRANQNGPESQGFRGNGNNLDLNRDFMKMDSKNARAFRAIMNQIDPDIIVDTHSTNGADYQYSMTLIPYQHEKWPDVLAREYVNWFEELFHSLNDSILAQYYVNVWNKTPEDGFSAFEVTSIFSGGYSGLYRTFNLTTEAHVFKSYPERVKSTMATLDAILAASNNNSDRIIKARKEALTEDYRLNEYAVSWELDSSHSFKLPFKGFEAEFFTSELTGQERYRYNRSRPITFETNFYPTYKPAKSVQIPEYYLLKRGQWKVIENLTDAGVYMNEFKNDTTMSVWVDYVADIEHSTQPYEGHFPHLNFTIAQKEVLQVFEKGDWIIPVRQPAIRFILEALEPQTPGSLFRWNYFDTYLQQKEWFSSYFFEEKALDFLKENPEISKEFNLKKQTDETFKNNAFAQLYWIYKQTPYYEKEHMRIPVFRIF